MKTWILALSALLVMLPSQVTAKGKNIRKDITVTLFKSTKKITKPNIPGPGGLEVNSFTGNLLVQRGDLLLGDRGLDIDMTFSYNSGLSKNDVGMGRGWSSILSMMYEVTASHVIIRWGDGGKDSFSVSGTVYSPPVGVYSSLSEYQPGKLLLQTKYGLKFYFDDASHKRLTKVQDLNDNTLVFGDFTSGGTATSITGARYVLRAGIPLRVEYIADSSYSPPRVVNYQYDARGNLKRVTDPLGHITRYSYDAKSRLVRILDPRGNSVDISYNVNGAVSSITTPGTPDTPPTSMTFMYNPGAHETEVSELVNGVVQTTTFTFDASNRVVAIQQGATPDMQYQYDVSNNVTQVIDANGNPTTFTYDTKGNCLSEADALSQSAFWTYDPLYSRITSHTDRRGGTTGFLLDAHANPISITTAMGTSITNVFDIHGNLVSTTDFNGNTTTFTHDLAGNVVSATLPIGSMSFTYDNSGRLESSTDPNGHTTTFVADALDRCVLITNALSGTTSFTYDGNSNVISVTDENAHSTLYAYNALDELVGVTTPAGSSSLVRDEYGNVRQTLDPNGNLTQYGYDSKNRLTSITNALGVGASCTWDNLGLMLSSTDFNGNLTAYLHDGLNRLTRVTDALGHFTQFTYDANNNLLSVTDANNHATSYTYDAINRWTLETRPIGSSSVVYDDNSNVLSHTDPNGHTMSYVYDAMDQLISVTDPLLHTTMLSYDPAGNMVSCTDPNGLTSTYGYNALNRLIVASNPLLEMISMTYDPAGNRTSVTTPYGNTITYTYDAADRPVSMSDVLGTLETYTYDAKGNCLTTTDGNGNPTNYTHDALDRLIAITAPLGQTALYAYDNNSNIVSTTDGAGGTTTLGYDALNRRISETFPGGPTATMGFDPVGNPVSILDARGNSTTMLYDANDRITKATYADASFRQCSYDPAGNRIGLQDQNGSAITYAYDAIDRLTARGYPDGSSDNFAYDNGGRLLTATNPSATVAFTYDGAGRVLSEELNGKITSTSYNVPSRVVTTALPGGNVITTALNTRLSPVTIASGAVPVVTYAYDAASRVVSQTNNNGTSTTYGYDDNSLITSVSHDKGPVQLSANNYTHDSRGFSTTVEKPHQPVRSEKYQYDATTRFTEYKEGLLAAGDIPAPVTQTQFTYDPTGNRMLAVKDGAPTSYVANTINAYTSISGSVPLSPTYDANGNMTSDGMRAFTYDYMDRLKGVFDVATTATYAYDALGRRIQKDVNGTITKYLYDGGAVVEERDGADAVTAPFILGNDAPVVMIQASTGRPYYAHYNSLGSVVALTDDSGHVVEHYEYDAFGNPSVFDSAYTPLASSSYVVGPNFGGQRYDAESGLYRGSSSGLPRPNVTPCPRMYMPGIGRHLQQDQASLMGDPPDLRNGYSYVGNNPTNYSSGKPKKLVNSSFVVREIADPGVHLTTNAQYAVCYSVNSGLDWFQQAASGRRKGWDGTIKGGTMADDDWKSPSVSAMPGNPIKGISVKGGRNHPSASATNFTVPFIGGGTMADDDWKSPSASAMPGNPIKGISVKGGRNHPSASATNFTVPFTGGGTMANARLSLCFSVDNGANWVQQTGLERRKGWDGTIKGRLSTNLSIERQTPKRDFGDRMKAGLETASGVTGQPTPVGELPDVWFSPGNPIGGLTIKGGKNPKPKGSARGPRQTISLEGSGQMWEDDWSPPSASRIAGGIWGQNVISRYQTQSAADEGFVSAASGRPRPIHGNVTLIK